MEETARSAFYKYGPTLIPTWINNYTHYNVSVVITYHVPNINEVAVKDGIGYVIPSHTLPCICLPSYAGVKVNSCK